MYLSKKSEKILFYLLFIYCFYLLIENVNNNKMNEGIENIIIKEDKMNNEDQNNKYNKIEKSINSFKIGKWKITNAKGAKCTNYEYPNCDKIYLEHESGEKDLLYETQGD